MQCFGSPARQRDSLVYLCVLDVPFWAWLWPFEFKPYNSSEVHGPEQINEDDDNENCIFIELQNQN